MIFVVKLKVKQYMDLVDYTTSCAFMLIFRLGTGLGVL